jgi:hypothetical protein
MKNKAARRTKRKTEKLQRQRARARIPRLAFSIDFGKPTPEFRDALFEATRSALKSPEGIELMEQGSAVATPTRHGRDHQPHISRLQIDHRPDRPCLRKVTTGR